jgi:hypothetical protein
MINNCTNIPELSETAEKELGGENIKFVVVVDNDGNFNLFKPSRVKAKALTERDLPISTARITQIEPVCIVGDEASPGCFTIGSGGMKFRFC